MDPRQMKRLFNIITEANVNGKQDIPPLSFLQALER